MACQLQRSTQFHHIETVMKWLMLPVWVLQLFTQAKSFKANRIIGNGVLNRLGLHVIRIVLSHSIMRLRFLLLSKGIAKEESTAYFENGYIVVPNVLPEDEFNSLRQEVESVDAEVRECRQGDTLTHRILIDESSSAKLPVTERLLASKQYLSRHKFASGKNNRPVTYIQTIKNHFVDGSADPQKNLHSDTFHPTMKSWYFLDNCDSRNGPFTYVPGSHRLSMARLRWEYKKSNSICKQGDPYSSNGSFRATSEDLRSMGLPEPVALSVPANTLVIANTHGFHRRGDASERSMRTEIWSISRSNPFNPFPGLDLPLFAKAQNKALTLYREFCDRRAEKRGAESSWHLVDARNTMVDDAQKIKPAKAA